MAYSDILSPEVIQPTVWHALIAIENAAALMCPVDTGNLMNSITIINNEDRRQHGTSKDGLEDYTDDASEGKVGSAAEYAVAVEFGRPDMPAYPAQPFLRPAADWYRSRIGQITGVELAKRMEEYADRHPYLGGKP